jgi:hypothetical protein
VPVLAAALPDATVMDRAVLLANELVTNAIVHAHTEIRLRLELRGNRLHIAVRDGSPRLLRMVTRPGKPRAGGGSGWLSSSPAPGVSTVIPTAARSCGASSTCEP